MSSATPKRGVGETSLIGRGGLFLGHIQVLEGAYEDEKAAFALSSCIGSFRWARSTTPRPHTPSSCGEKTPVEITALKSNISNSIARGTTTNTLKHSSIRTGHPICSSNVHDPFGSRSLSEAKSTLNTSGSGPAPALT